METAPATITDEEFNNLLQSMKNDLEHDKKPLSILYNWQMVLQEWIPKVEHDVNEAKDAVKKLLETRHMCACQVQKNVCETCLSCTQSIEEGFGFLNRIRQQLIELKEIGNRVEACISKKCGDDQVTENGS